MPMASVNHAHVMSNTKTALKVDVLTALRRSDLAPRAARALRPTVRNKAAYTTPPTIAVAAVAGVPRWMASTTARMHQESASSIAPQISASVPSAVPDRRRSKMMRASIGNAVVAIDAPKNIIAKPSETPFPNSTPLFSRGRAIRAPSASGVRMPAADTAAAVPARCLIRLTSKLSPTRNM
ncbi:hypothetical protein A5679_17540 [Mycobacterium scrofulaceum]|uniref:Uncharacterized protein n=1 Tax=Mycobacterium scrofulaceum TaxID=1783 RepID=A0A1A2VQC5_MYCSC|nr:hypothetical protein A5679_17540 [Mycobacterium scrofulaceum]